METHTSVTFIASCEDEPSIALLSALEAHGCMTRFFEEPSELDEIPDIKVLLFGTCGRSQRFRHFEVADIRNKRHIPSWLTPELGIPWVVGIYFKSDANQEWFRNCVEQLADDFSQTSLLRVEAGAKDLPWGKRRKVKQNRYVSRFRSRGVIAAAEQQRSRDRLLEQRI